MPRPPHSTTPAASPQRAAARALLCASWAAGRLLLLLALLGATFVVTSSAVAVVAPPAALRGLAGLALVLGLPLLLRALLRRRARGRGRPVPRLGGWFLGGWNLVLAAILCCSLSGTTGSALAAHGDWVLGGADGWFPRRYRPAVRSLGEWLARGPGPRSAADPRARPWHAPPHGS